MRHRMLIAALALIGTLLALYLWLWKLGKMGALVCGSGACETVQLSRYAEFLGLPVALYGVGGYAALLVVSLVGVQPKWVNRRGPTLLLVALAGVGVAFSAYLTYLEGAVIHAWCRWCLGSATIISLIFVSALLGLRRDPILPSPHTSRVTSPRRRGPPAS